MTGLNQGHLPTKIIDLKATPTGSMTFHPSTLMFLKYVISDYTSDASSYTLANRSIDSAKSLSIKGNYDNSNGLSQFGAYMTNVRFSIADEDILSVSADLKSLYSKTNTDTVEYVAPTDEPLTYIGSTFTVSGTEWDLQSLNITFDPKMIQKFGMNTKTVGRENFPSDIIRGGKCGISFDGVANVNDITDEIEVVWGGTSPQITTSELTLILNFEDVTGNNHTITMTGKFSKLDVLESDSEENSKTFSFSGVGIDFSVAGEI